MRPHSLAASARRIAAFWRDETGTVLTEFVIVMPMLAWTLIATYSYWDVYRSQNRFQKATYTVVDNISREPGSTTKAYITGLGKLMEYLIDGNQNAMLRVTSVRWVAANQKYQVMWSCSPGNAMPAHTTTTIAAKAKQLPTLVDLETLVLIEAKAPYTPPIGTGNVAWFSTVGVAAQTFEQFVPIKPRYMPQIELTGPACT